MTEILSVPLKKTSDVDIIKPLKTLISSTYSTADQPQDYTDAISELHKLRNVATKNPDRSDASLEAMQKYYDQLVALEVKIPASEVQIPFKWKDAFDKGSIFGGRISLTVSSIGYEKVCCMTKYNLANPLSTRFVSCSTSLLSPPRLLRHKILTARTGSRRQTRSCSPLRGFSLL